MKSLNFQFWKFFSIDSMLFSEGEMNSNLSLVKIDIRKRGSCRWGRVEPKTKFTHKYFSFELNNPIIELCKCRREVWRGKYSSILDLKSERLDNRNRKILIRKRINKTISINILKINRFCESLTDRKSSSFIFRLRIVSCVTANLLKRSKSKNISVHRLYSSCFCFFCKVIECFF